MPNHDKFGQCTFHCPLPFLSPRYNMFITSSIITFTILVMREVPNVWIVWPRREWWSNLFERVLLPLWLSQTNWTVIFSSVTPFLWENIMLRALHSYPTLVNSTYSLHPSQIHVIMHCKHMHPATQWAFYLVEALTYFDVLPYTKRYHGAFWLPHKLKRHCKTLRQIL